MSDLASRVRRLSRRLLVPALAAATLSSGCDTILGPKNKNEAPETELVEQHLTDRSISEGKTYIGRIFTFEGTDQDGRIDRVEYKIESVLGSTDREDAPRRRADRINLGSSVFEVNKYFLEGTDFTLTARAVDDEGKKDKTPVIVSFNSQWDNQPPETELVTSILSGGLQISFKFKGEDIDGVVGGYELLLEGPKSQDWINYNEAQDLLAGLPDGNYTFKVRSIDDKGDPDPTPSEYEFYLYRGIFSEGRRESRLPSLVTQPIEILPDNTRVFQGSTNREGLASFIEGENELIVEVNDALTQEPIENIKIDVLLNPRTNFGAVVSMDSTGRYFSDIEYLYDPSGKRLGQSKIFTSMNPASGEPFVIKEPERIPDYLDESEYDFLGTFPLSDIEQVYKDNDFFAKNASVIEFVSRNFNHPSLVLLTQANKARNTFMEHSNEVTNTISDFFGGTMDPDAMYWDEYSVRIVGFPVVTKELNEDGLCTIKGTVTDPESQPLREVRVSFENNQTSTDEEGNYRLANISTGNHNVRFEREGFETFSLDTLVQSAQYPDFIPIRINPVLEFRIREELPKTTIISRHENRNFNIPICVVYDGNGYLVVDNLYVNNEHPLTSKIHKLDRNFSIVNSYEFGSVFHDLEINENILYGIDGTGRKILRFNEDIEPEVIKDMSEERRYMDLIWPIHKQHPPAIGLGNIVFINGTPWIYNRYFRGAPYTKLIKLDNNFDRSEE